MNIVTTADLAAFAAKLNDAFGSDKAVFTVEPSTKYARIVRAYCGNRAAYGFIDLTNGDLLKADGWKRPAKIRRGSLFNTNPLDGCNAYSMAYLKL